MRLILFDGVCNLCNASVQFVIARDPAAKFKFASLGSVAADRRLRAAGVTGRLPDSIALLDHEQIYFRSTAALRIALRLKFPWPLLYVFIAVPRPLRDVVYDWVARHRYVWFGKRETCMIPTPDLQNRFLPSDIQSPDESVPAMDHYVRD